MLRNDAKLTPILEWMAARIEIERERERERGGGGDREGSRKSENRLCKMLRI